MTKHAHTIGTIEWDGHTYDIDWPFELDDETTRNPICAMVFEGDHELAELPLPGFGQEFESVEQIMEIAFEFIAGGGLDDAS